MWFFILELQSLTIDKCQNEEMSHAVQQTSSPKSKSCAVICYPHTK